ncbi:Histidine kinase-, DNA gyrase B-, and HSP90-like ATPase [Fibrobacter sp. UWB12]|nr:Histidine kinase-, DNA gyrase B-, and HSP90-like ATPase [Fibrobacter sp. UWB12]SIO14206.1 Histidine kinase-, DNA gyrase B-, and HSP90-like ATPase [Fibrobacter sp. UWB11]
MQESLFTNSPYVIALSVIALIVVCYFPIMLGQKTSVKQLPQSIHQLVIISIFWQASNLIGDIFFSGADFVAGTKAYTARQLVFGAAALGWIQLGNAVQHTAEISLKIKRKNGWKLMNIIGAAAVIISTYLFINNNSFIPSLNFFGYRPFAERPVFSFYSLLFCIFVLPNIIITAYVFLRNIVQSSDTTLPHQVSIYMLASFVFFVTLAALFDFVIPISTKFNNYDQFLKWSQFISVFLAILSGQYFTSVSFKNKSASWFLDKLREKMVDGLLYYNYKGEIQLANPAALNILHTTQEALHNKKVSSIFPQITDPSRESTYNKIRVKIDNEDHIFNVSIFEIRQSLTTNYNVAFFSDVSNTLHYQQIIKNRDEQFKEYQLDQIRYQERLNIWKKKVDESKYFLDTLISTLPFRFWSKNEQGVFMTQNQTDIKSRGNLLQTSEPDNRILPEELLARNEGEPQSFISYERIKKPTGNLEDEDTVEILKQDEYNMEVRKGQAKDIMIFENMFIPIIAPRKPYKIIGIKIDITNEKRLEKERDMLQEQKHIHSRLEELGTICGGFAHDYNNILGSQIGFCDLALEVLDKDNQAYMFIQEARKAATRGKESLEELLNTIRGKTSEKDKLTEFAPYMIIEDVVKKLWITLPPNVKVKADDIDKNIRIVGNVSALDRIISNLANNAIFAMKENGGTLTIALKREVLTEPLITPYAPQIDAGTYAKIIVEDTGTGMDTATLERIFSPFFTTKAPGEGLGLGLSSALRLLKEGNAGYTVQTTLGEGTIFNLYWSIRNEKMEA